MKLSPGSCTRCPDQSFGRVVFPRKALLSTQEESESRAGACHEVIGRQEKGRRTER